ncbi:reverse transcriptase [Ceratobasidium theobromae]|uniref:Reverse transcriptase n=1 Tax=Ceratobasidium theobromae TaxID=1582974 RepID=A0A5N5Q9C6_9AGAM|nr:reverse transcriptase [Ceratobasidium theobromae]
MERAREREEGQSHTHPTDTLPPGVIPVRKVSTNGGRQATASDLKVAFKPESPVDIDLVKVRANPNESRSCLMRLLKHCNEITSSREYKDKTDIRVESFSYSCNRNCIAVFTPKTNIKEVELFAPGLCGVMGLKGTVAVQRTSGWTRMRVLHFPAWATDPDTGEWLDRINTKEEILVVLQDFAPHDLLIKFPPVDVWFFKPDEVVRQCRPGGFEMIIISIDDPMGGAQVAYTNACLSFGYHNSFVSPHTTHPKIAECKRLKYTSVPVTLPNVNQHVHATHGSDPPKVSAASTQAPQPLALADNGLISHEIMQVNVVKSNTRIHALLASPDYNDISILIVSDPWWGPIGTTKHDTNNQHRLLGTPANPLWRCFAPLIDTQDPKSLPSCIVYVHKDRGITVEINPLAPATSFFFALDIFINGFSFKIIPIYLHGPKHTEAARDLFQLPIIETLTLVCGDFNIQHPKFVDFPGAKVKTSALEPRVQGHAPSIIDFTIVNGVLFSMDIISDWDSSFAHSLDLDHAAIFFTIHAPCIFEQPTRFSCFVIDPLMEDNWTAAFEHRVLELGLTNQVTCPQEVEGLASGILSACTWATEVVMESHPTQRKAPWVPWWNEDCSATCGRVVRAKEEGMDRKEIRACTSHLWYCIRKAKRSFFNEICSTVRPDNIWSINQWYRGRKSYGLPTLRKPDGTLATTNATKADLLHDTFFLYTPAAPIGTSVEAMPQCSELLFPAISWGKIAVNLASCSNKSTPGAHGSNYWVL